MVYLALFILLVLVFLFGMMGLRKGLFNLSADTMKKWIASMTDTPFKGMLAGIIVTALLHSSSAVMVITIGLISAGLLTFRQSIGIILGSNIGTTFTLEIITIDIDVFIVPLAILGAILMFTGRARNQNIGRISLGMAAVFAAMRGFSFLAEPLTSLSIVQNMLNHINDSLFYSLIAGTLITAIIQSSTAMSGILMSFLAEGTLQFAPALTAMLGANIGTCATALLASTGAGREARLTAYAHLWLNLAGTLFFFPFIDDYALIAPLTADRLDVQLAHASVLFNVVSSLVVLPFANQYGKMILYFHGKAEVK
ncbi:Na/Pi symporter [Mesobacillus maritimus]|uniref:Na/Pi symporter n=1 Tax=Mesobacillus maritimus TaxID=1643336 RepID=UPI00203A9202|nr:Na/Pi symporter [Mesobacillus maritimus]MCM3586282.1 Na/Pi symporter [Mesobacillus maritimus]MCM3671678.1 Na/Pi symporter [Mesobacillus maritimus]